MKPQVARTIELPGSFYVAFEVNEAASDVEIYTRNLILKAILMKTAPIPRIHG